MPESQVWNNWKRYTFIVVPSARVNRQTPYPSVCTHSKDVNLVLCNSLTTYVSLAASYIVLRFQQPILGTDVGLGKALLDIWVFS